MQVSTCWDEALDVDGSLLILDDLATRHALEGGLTGQAIASLIAAKDYTSLCTFELPLNIDGWDVLQLYHCRQALGFYTKLDSLDIGVDRERVAASKFDESESLCKATNDLFRCLFRGSAYVRARDARVLYSAQRKIRRLLGPCPLIEDLTLRLGPGATTSIKKRDATVQAKLADGIKCSGNLLASGLVPEILRSLPHWVDSHATGWRLDDEGYLVAIVDLDLHPGRLEFVPKNAKTYRAIVVEPVLNGMLQAGIGDYIAKRLKRHGIDITDQTRNAAFARVASINNSLATIDLSSASDTISRELVRFLLPEDWFVLLNAARSCSVSYMGSERHLEKFSSMGNGYTFPLETLIFWALTLSSLPPGSESSVGVYGDDIVCPSDGVADVVRTLELAGFVVNTDKSFVSGPFRESCGSDYYLGIACRPFYQKHLVSGASLFVLHNFYRRSQLYDYAEVVRKRIPRALRLYGPDGYGDGHLLSEEFPSYLPDKLRKKGYSGSFFETFTLSSLRSISRFPGDWVSPLYSIYRKGGTDLLKQVPTLTLEGVDSHLCERTPLQFSKDGRPFWSVPGHKGYKKVAIYTL